MDYRTVLQSVPVDWSGEARNVAIRESNAVKVVSCGVLFTAQPGRRRAESRTVRHSVLQPTLHFSKQQSESSTRDIVSRIPSIDLWPTGYGFPESGPLDHMVNCTKLTKAGFNNFERHDTTDGAIKACYSPRGIVRNECPVEGAMCPGIWISSSVIKGSDSGSGVFRETTGLVR